MHFIVAIPRIMFASMAFAVSSANKATLLAEAKKAFDESLKVFEQNKATGVGTKIPHVYSVARNAYLSLSAGLDGTLENADYYTSDPAARELPAVLRRTLTEVVAVDRLAASIPTYQAQVQGAIFGVVGFVLGDSKDCQTPLLMVSEVNNTLVYLFAVTNLIYMKLEYLTDC